MIKRSIYKSLNKWRLSRSHKPLLLRGARQVGKSFIVKQFGKREFSNMLTINFERDPKYQELFTEYNPQKIVEKMTLVMGQEITVGYTLIFLDEIQECPEAIVSLRYFYEEMPNLHIIAAGSLLEFTLSLKKYNIPVGRIQYLYMKPLSFGEFLGAFGENKLVKYLSLSNNVKNIPAVIHQKLQDLVRKYFILGGMPEVVNEYLISGDITICQNIQRSIIDTYEDDFGKYSKKSNNDNLRMVFYAAAAMVGQKFVYASVDNSVKSRELKLAVNQLEMAGILTRIRRTNGEGLPLDANVKDNYFKLLFLDIGLLHNINGIYGETIMQENMALIFKGAVAEQFVGQELLVLQNPLTRAKLFYWAREAKNSNAEVDYLMALKGNILPIEVKSGKSNKMVSLRMFMDTYQSEIAYRVYQDIYVEQNHVVSIPFYSMATFFDQSSLKMNT